MTFKRIVNACIALCITATLVVALCGCEDLGAYGDTEKYYNSFGDIVLISGASRVKNEYSVEKYFYNKESREEFLAGEDGAYKGVEHSDYVYMAIPFESTIDMDTLALYIQSQEDVTVYINVYVTNTIPSKWKPVTGNVKNINEKADTLYDDPDPQTRIGECTVHLEKGKWGSFLLDRFNLNGTAQKSIQIKEDQYVLLQIRNNSGVRVYNAEKQAYVDPQTGLELQKAEITMTNLLIRALDIKNSNKTQGDE